MFETLLWKDQRFVYWNCLTSGTYNIHVHNQKSMLTGQSAQIALTRVTLQLILLKG